MIFEIKINFNNFFDIRGKNLYCIDMYKNRVLKYISFLNAFKWRVVLILHRIFLNFSGRSVQITVFLSVFIHLQKDFAHLLPKDVIMLVFL